MANEQKKPKVWFGPEEFGLSADDVPAAIQTNLDALDTLTAETQELIEEWARTLQAPKGKSVKAGVFSGRYNGLGEYCIKMKVADAVAQGPGIVLKRA